MKLIFAEVDFIVDYSDAVGFEAAFLFVGATKGEMARKFAFAIDDFIARVEVAIGVAVKNITDDSS